MNSGHATKFSPLIDTSKESHYIKLPLLYKTLSPQYMGILAKLTCGAGDADISSVLFVRREQKFTHSVEQGDIRLVYLLYSIKVNNIYV